MTHDLTELPALRLTAGAASAEALTLALVDLPPARLRPGEALVRVESAGVNPSDVKAALGQMPHAVWPRTPGRDYAGTVVDGPAEWVGRPVWGSGGDLGISRDGSHAGWLVLPVPALRQKPHALSFDEAGAAGVPFVTAWEGFRRAGMVQCGQVVAVMGANGRVGSAAVQLAKRAGARVIAVQRRPPGADIRDLAHAEAVDAGQGDVAVRLREMTAGRGVDLIFNTVGSPYFEAAQQAMAKGATQILISTLQQPVPFDIFLFFRGRHSFVGIDTLALDCCASAACLDAMRPGFEDGTLRPFPVGPGGSYPLSQAAQAYRRVIAGADERVVLRP